MKTAQQLIQAITNIILSYPPGKEVWHKANECKGIVQGYNMDDNGSVYIIIDYGHNISSQDMIVSLSDTPIGTPEDGEEWKKV